MTRNRAEAGRAVAAAVARVERALTLYLLPCNVPQEDIHVAAVIAVREAATPSEDDKGEQP